MSDDLIRGIEKAKQALLEMNVQPSYVELTPKQYEELKRQCKELGTFKVASASEDSILGLKIVVKT
jgi:hypothetical protein